MRFRFEGSLYRANKTASELYLHLAYYPPRYREIPIKLPDGRFLRVISWCESYPPQVGEIEIIDNCREEQICDRRIDSAIAKFIDDRVQPMHLERWLLFNKSRSLIIIVLIDPENFTMAEDKIKRLDN